VIRENVYALGAMFKRHQKIHTLNDSWLPCSFAFEPTIERENISSEGFITCISKFCKSRRAPRSVPFRSPTRRFSLECPP
jgi:hypothetical protein